MLVPWMGSFGLTDSHGSNDPLDNLLMIEATDLKAGKTFLLDGNFYRVVKYAHTKIARGGGTVKLTVRNLNKGKLEEKTLNSNTKVKEIDTLKKPLQYLYSDESNAYFMDAKTYEQTEISLDLLNTQATFLKEGDNVDVLFIESNALSVDIPPKVTLSVKDTAPGIKGDTASNVYKSAVLENELKVKVPLFIKVGDKVRVDTRTGEYVERAK